MIRRGITLTEVLVAIFVTGLGLMALMTLFPLGAVNMALAIKDDRAQHAAANANAYLRTIWRQGLDIDQFDPKLAAALDNATPVYLDPVGQLNFPGGGPLVGSSPIPRLGLNIPVGNGQWGPMPLNLTMQYFSLLDDIEFGYNGVPVPAGQLPRETLYTWAFMLRPPQFQAQQAPLPPRIIDYSVVVYNRRSYSLNNSEITVPATFMAGDMNGSLKTIQVGSTVPVKKGDWVLDACTVAASSPQHAYFYRVDSVTQTGGGTILKVDQPLRGFATSPGFTASGPLVVMKSVIAVFEKRSLE